MRLQNSQKFFLIYVDFSFIYRDLNRAIYLPYKYGIDHVGIFSGQVILLIGF